MDDQKKLSLLTGVFGLGVVMVIASFGGAIFTWVQTKKNETPASQIVVPAGSQATQDQKNVTGAVVPADGR